MVNSRFVPGFQDPRTRIRITRHVWLFTLAKKGVVGLPSCKFFSGEVNILGINPADYKVVIAPGSVAGSA
jgi:hypothetical protein